MTTETNGMYVPPPPPDGTHHELERPGYLSNFKTVTDRDEKGKERKKHLGLAAPAIHKILSQQANDWPRRINNALFVRDGDRGPLWLTRVQDFFGWLQTLYGDDLNAVIWGERMGFVSRSEFHAYLQQIVTQYDAVESSPHEPPIPTHYYIHPPIEGGDGTALAVLLSRFTPHTEDDALLIKSFFLSLFWGGPYGKRPGFLFTGPDNDTEMGRGIGKSTLIRLASILVGGTFDVRPTDPWEDIIRRLLSNTECSTQRVILVDNVKTHRFSWADIEYLITAAYVKGRKMFVGDGSRPNTFTVAITLNGASLSKDLAQRCVIVKIDRPQHTGNWEEETRTYIESRRWAIVGDILAALRQPSTPLSSFSRWGEWEQEVLARLPDAERLQALITARQAEVDDDQQESDIIRQAIEVELELRGHGKPDDIGVKIPVGAMAKIVNEALNERLGTAAVTTKLRAMGGSIKELKHTTNGSKRVWTWRGKDFSPNGRMENLRERPYQAYR